MVEDPEDLSYEQLAELESVLYSQLHHTVDGSSSHPLSTLTTATPAYLVHTGEISMVKEAGSRKSSRSLLLDECVELPRSLPDRAQLNGVLSSTNLSQSDCFSNKSVSTASPTVTPTSEKRSGLAQSSSIRDKTGNGRLNVGKNKTSSHHSSVQSVKSPANRVSLVNCHNFTGRTASAKNYPGRSLREYDGARVRCSSAKSPVNHVAPVNGHGRAGRKGSDQKSPEESSLEEEEVRVISSEDSEDCEVIVGSQRVLPCAMDISKVDTIVVSDSDGTSSDSDIVTIGELNNIRSRGAGAVSGRTKRRLHASPEVCSDSLSSSDDEDVRVRGKRRCYDSRVADSNVRINISTEGGGTRFISPGRCSGNLVERGDVEPLFRQLLTSNPALRLSDVNTCPMNVLTGSVSASGWSSQQRTYYQQRRFTAVNSTTERTQAPIQRPAKFVQSVNFRYYSQPPVQQRCRRCPDADHTASSCPRPVVCHLCGNQGHSASSGCPDRLCYLCGSRDHMVSQCNRSDVVCKLCHVSCGHSTAQCPDLWRRYHCTVASPVHDKGHRDHLTGRPAALLPPLSCDVRPASTAFCYRCGRRGHFGHHCKGEHLATAASISQHVVTYDVSSCSPLSTAMLKICSDARFWRLFGGEKGDGARRYHVAGMEASAGASFVCQRVSSYWLVTARAQSLTKARAAIRYLRNQCFSGTNPDNVSSEAKVVVRAKIRHKQNNIDKFSAKKERKNRKMLPSKAVNGFVMKQPSDHSMKRQNKLKFSSKKNKVKQRF